jgi:hypothetical protein
MIESLVREHDRIELRRPQRRHGRERAHECARPGIDVDLRRAEAHPDSARRANLPSDDEPRPAGAEKLQGDAHRSLTRW